MSVESERVSGFGKLEDGLASRPATGITGDPT